MTQVGKLGEGRNPRIKSQQARRHQREIGPVRMKRHRTMGCDTGVVGQCDEHRAIDEQRCEEADEGKDHPFRVPRRPADRAFRKQHGFDRHERRHVPAFDDRRT